jgi:outer membrane biogenesis lipoprotein LolB
MIARRTFVALAVAVVLAAIPATASAGSPPAASYYTKQQLETMSQSWAAKAAVSSPTPEGNALLARIAAANAGDSGRPAASYYTKQQLETMRENWAAKAAVSSPTPEGNALLARIAAANAGRPAASYYTKQQLETMSQSWAAKAAASLRQTTDSSSTEFAWEDFGIGAAGMLGLVLLLGGVIVAVRHRRRSTSFAAHQTA